MLTELMYFHSFKCIKSSRKLKLLFLLVIYKLSDHIIIFKQILLFCLFNLFWSILFIFDFLDLVLFTFIFLLLFLFLSFGKNYWFLFYFFFLISNSSSLSKSNPLNFLKFHGTFYFSMASAIL